MLIAFTQRNFSCVHWNFTFNWLKIERILSRRLIKCSVLVLSNIPVQRSHWMPNGLQSREMVKIFRDFAQQPRSLDKQTLIDSVHVQQHKTAYFSCPFLRCLRSFVIQGYGYTISSFQWLKPNRKRCNAGFDVF